MGLLSKKKEIGPDTIIQRRNDLLFNEIDGEVVMLSIENGEYYGLDRVGAKIWELIKEPLSIRHLVEKLMGEYEIDKEQCISDTLTFINKLADKKLVHNND